MNKKIKSVLFWTSCITSKSRKIVIFMLISLTVFICISCGTNEEHMINKNTKYYSVDELKEVFFNNNEGFSEMVQILLDNDDFYKEKEARDGDGDARLIAAQDSKYFTDEEWEKIKKFFQDIQPLDITRYGGSAIGFNFPMNDEAWTTTLYYFVNGSNSYEFNYHESHYDIFEEIKNEWWIGEEDTHYVKRRWGWIF